MSTHIPSAWLLRVILGGCATLAGVTSIGCGPKNVRWDYSPEGPRHLSQSRRVAVLADEEIQALADALEAELSVRGYAVTVPRAGRSAVDAGADLLFELSAGYVKEPEPNTKVNVWPWVKVSVAYGKPSRWRIRVRHASIHVVRPADGASLGTVTVHYDEPTEDLRKVADDLAKGLEQIRQGKRPKRD